MFFILSFLSCVSIFEKLSSNDDTSVEDSSVIAEDNICGYSLGDKSCNLVSDDQFLEEFNLQDNLGSVVVIDFSTMWCGYCQVSASVGNDIYLEYKNEGFVWVTMLIEDSQGNIPNLYDQQTWSGMFELDHPVLSGSREEYIDYNEENGYSITSWPTFYILDRSHNIRYINKGWGESGMRASIKELLDE